MKSAQPWSFESTANGSEPHKFYPFKGVNVFHPIFDSKVNTKDRFQREVKEFENHKKVQVLNELEDAMPGFRTATEYHDTGMTRFEHILSHYSKDMTYKPGSDHIRLLEPKPDMLTVHTMMGYNKHKDPATFENLTHDQTRKISVDPKVIIPILKTDATIDFKSRNQLSTFSADKMPVPDDPSDYPGNTNLAEMGIPRDELATKIQKVFRGKLSREHGIDLTVEERRAEALKQYYDPFKYSKAVNKLRNLNVRDKELHQEQEKKRLKMLIANRKHFLGMDSKELVLTADRDPFQEKKLQIESNQTYEDLLADKLRPSQVEGGLKLDKLKWDVEESKISPDFSERRRSRGGRGRLNANRNTLSNTDLGYSDEIEFDLQNTGDSSSTPGKSSLGMESFIEDLAHSRSMSKSRSRGRIRGFRDQRGMESKEESIIDNESSGFGFIKNEVKGDKGNMRLEARVDINEDSDSNPFGVEKKADLYPTTSNNRQKPQDKPIAEIFYPQDPTSKHKNQRPDPAFDGQGLKYVLDRPGEVYLGLDPSIYGPLREKSKYTPKVESVHQAGSSNSKAILGTLANIAASMKHNNQAIQEISTVPQQVGQRPGPIVSEADRKQRMNEKLSVKLLEQITAARENMFNPDQLADLLTPIVKAQLQTPQPREELRSSPHSRADPLSENFFSTETFMQLYLNALKSRDEIAILDDQRHEATIRHLEDQIRRLTFAEDKLQDAVQKNKLLIEEEKDDILRRFAQALQERREKRDAQWKKKQGRPPEPQKPKGREGISPLNLTDLNKNSPTTKNKPSKLFDRAVAEESAESGTIVSDYDESRERIESISWVDSASTKQQKFTTFN